LRSVEEFQLSLPTHIKEKLALPLIAAPMFLVSTPPLILSCCKAGVIGTFPSLNCRSVEILNEWLGQMTAELGHTGAAPLGVNLIVHKSNARIKEDAAIVAEHKVPIVITSVGHPGDIVDLVHSYGGLVFHDVINLRHAEKAMEAGVDGLILVSAGAGGHGGLMNPFTFVPQIRDRFDGTIILSGTLSNGRAIRAAEVLGADLSYMGTRFIATEEAMTEIEYKEMITKAQSKDIIYTDKVSGIMGNFIAESLLNAGIKINDIQTGAEPDFATKDEKKAWKQVWSAGQGVGEIDDIPSVAALVGRLKAEYERARKSD
jgi:nitronate monooxygenase